MAFKLHSRFYDAICKNLKTSIIRDLLCLTGTSITGELRAGVQDDH